MEENEELPSQHLQNEEEEEARKWKFRQEAQEVISGIEWESQPGREVITRSFRRINRMIDRIEKDKFKYNFSDSASMRISI